METFGEWLLAQLQDRGWTQAELARRAHVAQPTLNRIVNETRQAGPDAALAIAKREQNEPEIGRLLGILKERYGAGKELLRLFKAL